MKNTNKAFLAGIIVFIMLFRSLFCDAQNLTFKRFSTFDGLPTNEVLRLYQDKDGLIWIATSSGLSKFDGYQFKNLRRDPYSTNTAIENILAGSSIQCLAEDYNHLLWIGTSAGLYVMDKQTGEIHKIQNELLSNEFIATITITRDNKIFVGADTGLYLYDSVNDTFILFNKKNTDNVIDRITVKSLFEDSKGNLWIGTWSDGLFRYDIKANKFVSYPKFNTRNSAHVVFEDSHNNLWVGAWAEGLYLLKNPYDIKNVNWVSYKHNPAEPGSITDNFIYAINEDLKTGNVWIGTRGGLSTIDPENLSSKFTNYWPGKNENTISFNEVNSIIRDNRGTIWLGMLGGGINMVHSKRTDFILNTLEQTKSDFSTNSVRSILIDDGQIWMGLGSYGLFIQDIKTGNIINYSQHPDFKDVPKMPTIWSVIKRKKTGEILFGTYGEGIIFYNKNAKKEERKRVLDLTNSPWLGNKSIYYLKEDYLGRIWICTRQGVFVSLDFNKGFYFDSLIVDGQDYRYTTYVTAEDDSNGDIWLGTTSMGALRLTGRNKNKNKFEYKSYSVKRGKLNCDNVQCFFEDSKKRLWVGTDGGGLCLYDKKSDSFIPVNRQYNMPGDAVFSIEEDKKGNLWMGTNAGLVKLSVAENPESSICRLFTVNDNLQDNIFIRNSCFMTPQGEMYFGGHKGYNHFFPEDIKEHASVSPIRITDIKIFNNSVMNFPLKERNKISTKSPGFTRKIRLNYKENNFSIEFAALTYINPLQCKYAYMLEGFDKNWQYTDATRRFAYYNNLKDGEYVFRLKAANENGIWSEMDYSIEIDLLPPPWKTWWAYLIYLIISVLIAFALIKTVRNRIRLRNELHIREVENAKSEELNHAKLQFFTNITHELLTPLTIISASLDELKTLLPGYADIYQTMDLNINRLIRLLQQILEFRKAESGNLKLKVSKGNLSAFIKTEVDSFSPLMKKKKMHFSFVSDPEKIIGYFDPDKIDKILYNLMSNAAKYNDAGGFVQVSINHSQTEGQVIITVRDNGKGISKEDMGSLFKRFYEGDYRKFQTIGTGIGLSLTKDLVELHNGLITVESLPDQGTTFTVILPIERSYFKEEEIDDETVWLDNISDDKTQEPEIVPAIDDTENNETLLLIEDNEDLLKLMVKLLGRFYKIFTATNGKEGLVILENEDIDLVVSDIMMPEMDGIEFCKSVKGNVDICHIPVILLTAKTKEEDRIEAYDSGADGFISKPFNLTVLHAKIKNLLKNKERTARDFKKQLVFEVKELNYTSIDESFIQKAVDCVHKHLNDPDFDQMQFSVEMGTSKSTLYKKLKSLTGLNTSAFIRNIRLKAACKIAEEKKNLRISELAYAVGFNDPKYFSACFRKEFGMLPSEYIERYMPGSEIDS